LWSIFQLLCPKSYFNKEKKVAQKKSLLITILMKIFFLFCFSHFCYSQIVINEFLAGNESINVDEDGDYEDWIELYNKGTAAVNLQNYTLTDNDFYPRKWTFPSVTIGPNQFLLVWASNKDRVGNELHTNFNLDKGGEYIALVEPDGELADSYSFGGQIDDISFGRITDGGDNWGCLDLPTPGWSNTEPPINIIINEFLVGNVSFNTDSDGDYSSWIELYNAGPQAVDLFGFSITNNSSLPTQWTFPTVTLASGNYLIIWASQKNRKSGELHTNFSLSIQGGFVGLYQSSGVELNSHTYTQQLVDVSLARIPNGNKNFKYTASPTPGTSNLFTPPPEEIPKIAINEFLAVNSNTNTDVDGDYEDWLELYNYGNQSVNLTGFSLTDDIAVVDKWKIPARIINPGGFLVIWTSGKNRTGDELHTNFSLARGGEYLGLYTVYGSLIDGLNFTEQLDDISSARSPDGTGNFFSTTTPTPGTANVIQIPSSEIPDIVINEFLASNNTVNQDEDGANSDWIEIYNYGYESVNLIGLTITDDKNDKDKWTFPNRTLAANQYLIIWASGKDRTSTQLHTNFKLDAGGEFIGIYSSLGATIDSTTFANQQVDISEARIPNGSGAFQKTLIVTPGAQNQSNPPPTDLLSFQPESGYYNSSLFVTLSTPVSGAVIRYSTDGSSITGGSRLYSSPISISNTKVMRARVFVGTTPISEDISHNYQINFPGHLPVLSLATDESNLYGSTGIYDNYDEDWEKPVSVNFLELDGSGFRINAGVRIHGQHSRVLPKKSFRLYFRSSYGYSKLNYKVFDEKNINSFDKLVIHSGGSHDQYYHGDRWTLMRDPLSHRLAQELGGHSSASRPVLLYLNGECWGIYHFRERISDEFLNENYNIQNADLLKWHLQETPEVETGDLNQWNSTYTFFANNSMNNTSNYQQAQELIDIQNYINDWIIHVYSDCRDWPDNNSFAFREKVTAAKWNWLIWDAENSYKDHRFERFKYYLENEQNPGTTLIMRKLLENSDYKKYFLNRFADCLNTVLLETHTSNLFWQMTSVIEPDIPLECNRWGTLKSEWDNGVSMVQEFINGRPFYQRYWLSSYFNLAGTALLTLRTNISKGGKININTITPSSYPWSGHYFMGNPITLTAIPNPGYEFSGWSDASLPANPTIEVNLTRDKMLLANFAPNSIVTQTIAISPSKLNSISFNMLPENVNFQSLADDVESLLIVKDSNGNFYIPPYSVNTIGDADLSQGYKIYITGSNSDNIVNTGVPLVPQNYSHSLTNTQLYMIGYPYQDAQPIEDVLASIKSSIVIVKDDDGKFWIPQYFVNTIGNMLPGKGYDIFVSETTTYTYPELSVGIAKTKKSVVETPTPIHFQSDKTGVSYAIVVTESEEELQSNDEVAVFAGDVCVGAGVFRGNYPLAIAAWQGFEEYNLIGFEKGQPITFRIWKAKTGMELEIEGKFLNVNESVFGESPLSVAVLNKTSSQKVGKVENFYLNQNYPNPFNAITMICFQLAEDSKIDLTIYNMAGEVIRHVETGNREAGSYTFSWDGMNESGQRVASGIYFCRLKADHFSDIKKMILIK
jgi:hypothetical protein